MEKELGQEEIDALFHAARARAVAAPAEPHSRVLPWSFSRSGQISNEQLRAISVLNDIFARNLTHHLSAWLRSRVQVSLVSAEQIPFSEFLQRIPELAYVCSVRLEPLRAVSVLQMDLNTAPLMIDLLLGGDGAPSPPRELTDIEESILSGVAEAVCRELTTAWQPVGLTFGFEKRQMQTQTPRLIPVSEKTLCLSFELRLLESSGLLNLAFPAVVSNAILRRLAGEKSRQRRHAEETRRRMVELTGRCRTRVTLELPRISVAADALAGLRSGSILKLDLPARTPAQLRAGGVLLFSAAPVGQSEHRAAHLLASSGVTS
ncbi:MAG TPA: flagellar motor switch protein FliM [Acidobacteriaceae bacterium]|jgi:flagellar motor switch protein FliM|nr:flagellar motor switch protein FliM [Acidobacteriaceae bacterium]